jgi:adenylylsulfate kinase-like enzyme
MGSDSCHEPLDNSMKHPPATLWLTGPSAAGKTTLAQALADALATTGAASQILDGDVVRRELSRDLGRIDIAPPATASGRLGSNRHQKGCGEI